MIHLARNGFSLLETIVAIGVLLIAIVGPLTVASFGLKATSSIKNNLIAGQLAQEAIELVRTIRGNNFLQGNDWLKGLDKNPGDCDKKDGCIIDSVNLAPAKCAKSGCVPLKFDSASALYNYTSGDDSIFTRRIDIDRITGDEERVTVTVTWQDRFGAQSFSVEEIMYNWTP